MAWEDKKEKEEQSGKKEKMPDEAVFDHDLFEHYRKLIYIRNSHPALQLGYYQTLLADDERDLFAFSRTYQNQQAIVVINNSRSDQLTRLAIFGEGEFADRLDHDRLFAAQAGWLDIEIKAKTGRVLVRR
jgi:glycosidase